jgi:hypothetical protein
MVGRCFSSREMPTRSNIDSTLAGLMTAPCVSRISQHQYCLHASTAIATNKKIGSGNGVTKTLPLSTALPSSRMHLALFPISKRYVSLHFSDLGKRRSKPKVFLLVLVFLTILLQVWLSVSIRFLTQPTPHDFSPPIQKSTSSINAEGNGIVYVHVGKTGGEWLKAQLEIICKTRRNPNIRMACLQQRYPSLLSKQTIGYIHASNIYIGDNKRRTVPRKESVTDVASVFSHYLFTVRHPLRRLISWYTYNHPTSCAPREPHSPACKTSDWKRDFFDCFPTMQSLGEKILSKQETDVKCYNVLWNGWQANDQGVGKLEAKEPNHLHWNYQVCRSLQGPVRLLYVYIYFLYTIISSFPHMAAPVWLVAGTVLLERDFGEDS